MHAISVAVRLLLLISCITSSALGQWRHLGLAERQVNSVAVAEGYIYAASDSGLFRSPLVSDGSDWELVGMVGSNVTSMVALAPDLFLAGCNVPPTSIYRSTDSGQSWSPYQNNFGGGSFHVVRTLERAPGQSDTVFAVGLGMIARSIDAGQSWQPVLGDWEQPFTLLHFVKVDDFRHQTVWTGGEGVIFNPQLYKSTNAGESWETLNVVYTGDNRCHDVATHPTDADLAYVSMEGQIQKTTDGGENWEIIHWNIFYLYGIELDSLRPDIFYVSGAQSGQPLSITKTDDGGETFTEIVEPTQPVTWAPDLLLLPYPDRNVLLFPTNLGVFRYIDSLGPLCGDADGNDIVNISDAVYLIAYIFGGGPAPDPPSTGDADCNQIVNISDAVYLIAYIFGGGAHPCAGCPD
jgi:hypothetical protein